MSSMKIHFGKILELEPAPISCMSLNHKEMKLALFRGPPIGAIELWDVSNIPILEKRILELEKIEGSPSVESILWVETRLFTCGLHGFVIEHDVCSGEVKGKYAATSGPVWCLAAAPSGAVIAAGTEDGFVNLFKVEESGLTYLKVLDRQDGRVLCLQYSPCGRYIATGSTDSIRLWDVEKGHALQRLLLQRTKNKETIVWSILVLEDFTIVSGDSRGIVSFWDGSLGVLKYKIQSHKADVLSLRLSQDKSSIYTAGVDPIIVILTKTVNEYKWVKSHQRNVHFSDVLCLETDGKRLFSGGSDCDLGVSSFPPKIISKYPPLPKSSQIKLTNSDRIFVENSKSIDIWRLGNDFTSPAKLLHLKTKNSENIFSSSSTPCGSIFGYSTTTSLRLFTLDKDGNNLQKIPTTHNFPLHHLQFINKDTIFLINSSGSSAGILSLSVGESESESFNELDFTPLKTKYGVSLLSSSSRGNHLAVAYDRSLRIYKLVDDNDKLIIHCDVPTNNKAQMSSIAFHPTEDLILVSYSDCLVQLFDFESLKIVFQEELNFVVRGGFFNENELILYGVDFIVLVKISSVKKKKKKGGDFSTGYSFEVKNSNLDQLKNVAYVGGKSSGGDLVAVEVDQNSFLEKLPGGFSKRRFGGM